MTVKYCDACGEAVRELPGSEQHTVKLDNWNPNDLCPRCAEKLKDVLNNKGWQRPQAAPRNAA